MIQQIAAIFVLSMLIVFSPYCSFASDKDFCSGKRMKEFKLGELEMCTRDESEDGNYLLRFSKNKEVIFSGECAFKIREPQVVRNAPLPDCSSLLAYCFSGGAHCCTTLFIATECGQNVSLTAADLAHSDGKVDFIKPDGGPQKVLRILDWQFAYYAPEDLQIQLSFASSPAMVRLLVFEGGHWRPDRIGEFGPFYSRLLDQTMQEAGSVSKEPESAASAAITAAYYLIMSGQPFERAVAVLNQLLPIQWRMESPKIAGDIRHAASQFNPLEQIR